MKMTRKQRKRFYRILISTALLILAFILPYPIVRFAICACAYILAGYDVVWKSVRGIIHGQFLDENFLMMIATVGAFILGEYHEGVFVMLFYQVGELFQDMAVANSRASIAELMNIRPDVVNIMKDGELVETDPETLAVGDIFYVKPGEKVALDGEILEGNSSLDMKALTGESMPVEAAAGSAILSGSINLTGLLKVQASKVFGESTVSRILHLVEEASDKKSHSEQFISRFARFYTPIVVGMAVLLALIPTILSGGSQWQEWLSRALVFLVISCPCALVISVPLSFFGGIGAASKAGILVKGSNFLEILSKTGAFVFDKTGTLTHGEFAVAQVCPAEGIEADRLLEIIALAECDSEHPIALSIKKAYGAEIDRSRIRGTEVVSGKGIKAIVDDREVYAGNLSFLKEAHLNPPEIPEYGTVIYAASEGQYLGALVIRDQAKAEAKQTIAGLHDQHIACIMLTGDRKMAAEGIAKELNLDAYHAELLPGDKVEQLESILKQHAGAKVAFVGDGINDAPVLTRADIGIAMGGIGSDAAIEAADLVIMNDDLSKLNQAIAISRRTLTIVKENILFAIGVKVLFLLLSALGITNMWLGVFADVGVAVLCILNAMRCLKMKR